MTPRTRILPPAFGALVMVVAAVSLLSGATLPVIRAMGVLLACGLATTVVQVVAYSAFARWMGVAVYGVYLGGGPRILGVVREGVVLELRSLPVGGMVSVYPEDVDPGEAEDPPPHAMALIELSAPLASLCVAVILLGPAAAEAVGLVPVQLGALMVEPSTRGRDVVFGALELTEQAPQVVLGTVSAKLGVVQIPANLMRIGQAITGVLGFELGDDALLVLGIAQVALTTWALFGFVYALSMVIGA